MGERPDGCSFIQWAARYFYADAQYPWQACCEEHDWAYIEMSLTRLQADRHFRDCVARSGYPVKAAVMYRLIRLGGWVLWYDIDKRVVGFVGKLWQKDRGVKR